MEIIRVGRTARVVSLVERTFPLFSFFSPSSDALVLSIQISPNVSILLSQIVIDNASPRGTANTRAASKVSLACFITCFSRHHERLLIDVTV